MLPMPRLRVKNEWPRASSTPAAVSLSQFIPNRKSIASPQPDIVIALPSRIRIITNSPGIMIRAQRSMPCDTPAATTHMVKTKKANCQPTPISGEPVSWPKSTSA